MNRKYQVFISSTFEDLKEERKEIMQVLLEMDCIPSGMELFQASDDSQWELIKKVIASCDYYIVIIAGRYGSVHPDTQKSYTQMEYEYAVQIGIPIVGFLIRNVDDLPSYKAEKSKKLQKKLQQFRDLTKNKMIKYWSNKAELASAVSISMHTIIKTHPRVGWIKPNNQELNNSLDSTVKEMLTEIKDIKKNLYNQEYIDHRLEEVHKLQEKLKALEEFEAQKEAELQYKIDFYNKCIKKDFYKIEYTNVLTIGKFHIDALCELMNTILTAGIDSLASFIGTKIWPNLPKFAFFNDYDELIKNFETTTAHNYYSTFSCSISGFFFLNYKENFINIISTIINELNIPSFYNKESTLLESALYEFGSIFTGNCITTVSAMFNEKVNFIKHEIDVNLMDKIHFGYNNTFLVLSLSDQDKNGCNYIDSYLVIEAKYMKHIFEKYDLYIK